MLYKQGKLADTEDSSRPFGTNLINSGWYLLDPNNTVKFNFKNILIVYIIIFFLWNLPTFISKLNINKAYVFLNTIGFVIIAVFCVCIIILIIFKMSDKIAYFIKQIKISIIISNQLKMLIILEII